MSSAVNDDELKSLFEENQKRNEVVAKDANVDKAIDHLLKEAASFEESKHVQRAVLLKVAFGMAGVLGATTVALAVAIAVMMPLKEIQPLMITTYKDGYAEVIRDFSEDISFPVEVDEYFLKEYVATRETYDWHKMQYIADYTKAWSADYVYNEFYNFVMSEKGALVSLADRGRIDTRITSINLNKNANMATVRFTKTPQKVDGQVLDGVPASYWVAEIIYEMNAKQKHKDREFNPFGYRVISYKLIQDKTK